MKWTVTRIREAKGRQKIAALTAYDFSMARMMDEAGIPLLLVGDSLAMTVLGYEDTLPVTVDEMLHHTRAVSRGAENALVVGDMPFLSYQVSDAEAVINAGRFLKEGGADAVKIEGGSIRVDTVAHLVANGIPVMGHIGLTPQSVKGLGGFKVQGRDEASAARLLEDARALEEAGIFSLVLEGLPASLAEQITREVSVPTIGIGAGAHCDGQVLVVHDLLGLFGAFKPRFVKQYVNLGAEMSEAFKAYMQEVEQGLYPDDEHSY